MIFIPKEYGKCSVVQFIILKELNIKAIENLIEKIQYKISAFLRNEILPFYAKFNDQFSYPCSPSGDFFRILNPSFNPYFAYNYIKSISKLILSKFKIQD